MSRIKLTLAPLYGAQAKSGTPQQTLTLTLMGYVVQGTAGGGPDGVGLPAGGSPGQALVKRSTTNFDAVWGNPLAPKWGELDGQIGDQEDLMQALAGKAAETHDHDGRYLKPEDLPALGSAASSEVSDFATAAQGAKADTALQGGAGLPALDAAAASKLGGVSPNATANDTDANLRDRATHTGEQPLDSLARGGAVDGDVIQWDAALGRWVARTPPDVGVSSSRAELMVSDTDSPPVILTNEDATDFLYSD